MTSTLELIQNSQQGSKEAKEVLITENAGLIWSVAKRFVGRGVDPDDLYQLGCLGFLKAVDGFDISFGTQFSTYAVPKIAGEIRRFIRDDGTLKVSRSVKEQAQVIKTFRNKLILELSREPTISELVEVTGYTREEIAFAETATSATESIYKESDDGEFSLENMISTSDSEEVLVEKVSLKQAISQLPERERSVIQLRYFHGLTQERVSDVLSVSQVQVSRIEKRAISRLRELLN
jgi:RNA polymerase sporulation-specific sigma factor